MIKRTYIYAVGLISETKKCVINMILSSLLKLSKFRAISITRTYWWDSEIRSTSKTGNQPTIFLTNEPQPAQYKKCRH